MKAITLLLSLLACGLAGAQPITMEVRFSKPLAVLEFMQRISEKAPPNALQTIFNNSTYHAPPYTAKLAAFDSIAIDYGYEFRNYPSGQKVGGSVELSLKRNLFNSSNLKDFQTLSIGLIPMSDLILLTRLIGDFTPVYETLIFNPNKVVFEKQLSDIEGLLGSKNIATYFDQAKQFYHSSWDNTIPFFFTFYPLPNSKGFTATAFGNIALSAIPTTMTDYNALLSVLLHEMSHILCDEQPLPFKIEMDHWFSSNPSKYSRYAEGLVQESWATAVGNGYFSEKLAGTLNPGSWYNRKYINLMGKKIFPLIRDYIDHGKPFDKALVDQYIRIFEDNFPDWLYDIDYLLTGRTVIAENHADVDFLDRRFPYHPVAEYYNDFSESSFQKLVASPGTKLIIVSHDNEERLSLIKSHFSDLKNWHPNAKKDFSEFLFLSNKSQLIIINLVTRNLEQQIVAMATNKP